MTTVCIHQPDFAPFLGFFHKIVKSDIYVVFDHVQYIKRGWHHRDQIKTKDGPTWLTVPVLQGGRYKQKINEVEIDNSIDWQQKHLDLIRHNYARAAHFQPYFGEIAAIYEKRHAKLLELNMDILRYFFNVLGIERKIVFSSEFGFEEAKNELLVKIVKAVGADAYYTGSGSRDYLDEKLFADNGIRVIWQEFKMPAYEQPWGPFVPNLSMIDTLLNCGGAGSRELLRSLP